MRRVKNRRKKKAQKNQSCKLHIPYGPITFVAVDCAQISSYIQYIPVVLITGLSDARSSCGFRILEKLHADSLQTRTFFSLILASFPFFHSCQFPLVFLSDDMTQRRGKKEGIAANAGGAKRSCYKQGLQGNCARDKHQQLGERRC